ncbi:hypothetical protein Scep_022653 [Stephania cephalantha]|uniref:Uncharacterized protein n=1 Tax=Stephania cephalantha TaxID=152367 RepID=A0AAP0I2V1_9MAGN
MEKVVIESVAMNGGVGDYSYANNSSLQRSGFEAAKSLIHEAIMEKLDIKHLCNGNSIRITDLGCSVGPNTFIAVENIVEAIEQKHHSEGLKLPCLNSMSTSMTKLFPEKSIDLVYSLGALQWLSKVPEDVVNIGRIHYSNAPSEVMEAYKGQFSKDMERFLDARAKEVAHGGLMALSFPCIRDGQPYSRFLVGVFFSLLGSALMDMVKMGKVDQTKVDSFNVPFYAASPKEVEALVERNGHFTIERKETQDFPILQGKGAIQVYSKHNRACSEGLIRQHFGHDFEIIDELFDLFTNKLSESFSILEESSMNFVFVLLKRKQD